MLILNHFTATNKQQTKTLPHENNVLSSWDPFFPSCLKSNRRNITILRTNMQIFVQWLWDSCPRCYNKLWDTSVHLCGLQKVPHVCGVCSRPCLHNIHYKLLELIKSAVVGEEGLVGELLIPHPLQARLLSVSDLHTADCKPVSLNTDLLNSLFFNHFGFSVCIKLLCK